MTNEQLIHEFFNVMGIDFEYDGDNLHTFQGWKAKGMSVKKGEKAFVKIDLWSMKMVEKKDEEGKVIMKDGKPEMEKKFYLRPSAMFTADQVEKAKEPKKKAAAKSKGKKKKAA